MVSAKFWKGKRVLLTGHSGFKGAWLAIWLHHLGAKVYGVALPPVTEPNLFELARVADIIQSHDCDIRDATALAEIIRTAQPEIVLHLAAQALVRPSYEDPVQTFATNIMGTAHLLNALRGLPCVRVALVITTDKVYRNQEWFYPYREEDALGGHDPYSASKAATEIVAASYRDAFLAAQGVAVATARAGNVIGGGDWAVERLLPDAVRAWQAGLPLEVRRPEATRPWQHVLEPLACYLRLAEALSGDAGLAGAYNFGPDTHEICTVRQVVNIARDAYGGGDVIFGDGGQGPHEAGLLALEIAKARAVLNVSPRWRLGNAVQRTIAWYRQLADGGDAHALCLADIAAYEAAV